MHLPPPIIPPQNANEPPALIRVVTREEIHWNRPTFKAPPLEVTPPVEELFSAVQLRRHERRSGK